MMNVDARNPNAVTATSRTSMEDRSNIRLSNGIVNARRCSMAAVKDSAVQAVTVEDGHGEVLLCLQSSSYPAGLTPDQAMVLARQLTDAAERVRAVALRTE